MASPAVLIPDVNVFVYAFRPDSSRHEEYKAWLEFALAGAEPVGISELVASGMARIVTNHRVYGEPDTATSARGPYGLISTLMAPPALDSEVAKASAASSRE
jgi:predicted nucleic acid-binding protein